MGATATVVLLGTRGMNCGPWRTATMRIRIRRIKKQFIAGPGSGRSRLARGLRIGLSNSCQEAIARSKSQPFQVSIQGPLVMLGFILRLRSVRPDGAKSVPVSKIPTPNSLAAKKAHPYCSYRKPNAPFCPGCPYFPI